MMAAIAELLAGIAARAVIACVPLLAAGDGEGGGVKALGKTFSAISKSVRVEERHSPMPLLIVVAAALVSVSIYGIWRWQQRRGAEPSSRAMLKLACNQLNLSPVHRQLLWLLGTAAGLEPASALVSPQLLTCLVDQAERAGLHLSGGRTLQVGQILDAVSAASVAAA